MKRSGTASSWPFLAALAFVLASAGCAGRQEPEWKGHQSGYSRLFSSGELKPAIAVATGIRERRATTTGVVERCTSCHLGTEEPALKDAVVSRPYRFHPDVTHPAKELGCTTCHRGSAMALTSGEAHFGPSPTLPLRFSESSCGRCHLDRIVAEASHLTEGRLLIARLGCAGCHEIPGFENERNTGYDLDGLGSKVNRAWLVKWLANPKGYLPSTTMPTYRFTASEIAALADFLLDSTNGRVAMLASEVRRSAPAAARAVQSAKGEAAVARLGCVSCHAFGGKGGTGRPRPREERRQAPGRLAPRVAEVPARGLRRDADAAVQLSGPGNRRDRRLPRRRVRGRHSPRERRLSPFGVSREPGEGSPPLRSSGCVGCHSRSGISRPGWLAPKLDGIGDKSALDLNFGVARIERTLASWLKAKVISPHVFDPTLRMPDFQLTETEADDITTASPLARQGRPAAARGPLARGPASAALEGRRRSLREVPLLRPPHARREGGSPSRWI